ncbi:MAG: chorismate mutase [Gemmatimonadetes bacterium]|jgi:chorismate mutase|nr:chorismate mutase [Gemmatimonadota bacterium]MBT6148827.1 chorismate mutase [Gemmatimonadota bacterium]MBT7860390.1 chorismate mutase [Gemmatimonadota bacterium]
MDISDWRTRIDTLDQVIIDLLNRRMEYALEIGKLKHATGLKVRDAQREREVIDRLKAANEGPLSDEAISDLYTRIIAEARHLEGEGS